ncbi:hypothetical protein [Streptomyces sp. NPDC058424]|uniref:hypothetical protein n=1 Tax=Streptomyces sp. NPDC058424 TaxID=3346491 RepID=UPI0036635360
MTPEPAATRRAVQLSPMQVPKVSARDADAAIRRVNRHVRSYAEAISEVEERTAIGLPEE